LAAISALLPTLSFLTPIPDFGFTRRVRYESPLNQISLPNLSGNHRQQYVS